MRGSNTAKSSSLSSTLSSSPSSVEAAVASAAGKYPMLSVEFLSANGITVNKTLKNWITRAAFLAKTRNSTLEKNRYERWALYTIEEAMTNGKGVDSVDWRSVSPIMPTDAPECHPRLLTCSQNSVTELSTQQYKTNTAVNYSAASSMPVGDELEYKQRQKIWEEINSRAPVELRPFILQAFELYDKEVNQHKRSYAQVTMIEMLNIAKNLHKRTIKAQERMQLQNATVGIINKNNSNNTNYNSSNRKSKNIKENILHQVNAKAPIVSSSQLEPKFSVTMQNSIYPREISSTSTPTSFSSSASQMSTSVHLAPFSPTSESLSLFQTSVQQSSSRRAFPLPIAEMKQTQLFSMESNVWTPTISTPIAEWENAIATPHKRQRQEQVNMFGEEKLFFIKASTRATENEFAKRAESATSQELERMYSRYEPKMEDIRSLPVLLNAFEYVHQQANHKECVEGRAASLKYLSDQLKGIRQDLRVQNIVNDFTIRVYEEHAKLSLETGELGEFNQCQASLKQFYNSNNNFTIVNKQECHVDEFFQYRLFYLYLSQQTDALSTELINWTNVHEDSCGARVSLTQKCEECLHVMYVLRLCKACNDGNCRHILHYLEFFPLSMWFLLRIFLQKLRISWLHEIAVALRGQVSVHFVLESLGFLPVMVASKLTSSSNALHMLTEQRESSDIVNFKADDDKLELHNLYSTSHELEATTKNETAVPYADALCISENENSMCWLDRSQSNALAELNAIFTLLKLELPANFSFDDEVKRVFSTYKADTVNSKYSTLTPNVASTFLDVGVLRQSLDAYLQFLNTRNDAKFCKT